jgi:hypothetical protein
MVFQGWTETPGPINGFLSVQPRKRDRAQPVPVLLPVIPATQEAEIRRIAVQSQPRANCLGGCTWKKPITKKSTLWDLLLLCL